LAPSLRRRLIELYGEAAGERLAGSLAARADAFRRAHPRAAVPPAHRLDQDDVLLIAYAGQVRAQGEAPLRSLGRLLHGPLAGTVSGVHLLPFYPYSSDDGFSVIDYRAVDPQVGDWDMVHTLARDHRLMFDAVVNHVSAQSAYLRGYLAGDQRYADFFREEAPDADLSLVVRPRTSPLLTPFTDTEGRSRYLWTTFSADQVDLDYRTPAVLEEILDVLLGYVDHGAELLRFDAVTYLWKERGTSCASLPRTHALLQVVRGVLERAAPWVVMLTETNVPHEENLTYFGGGDDEAQMVYNFALPPMMLHTALSGDGEPLRRWAASLRTPGPDTAFLNFLASHDGIGLRPVEALLPGEATAALVRATRARRGSVSSRALPDGGECAYELNINLLDALTPPGDRDSERIAARMLAVHAAMLAMAGVPAIYLHSLLGSKGDTELARRTGRPRSVNRATLELRTLASELARPEGLRARVLNGMRALLVVRRRHPAFHPQASQHVLATRGAVYALQRRGEGAPVWCLHNLGEAPARVPGGLLPRRATDLLRGTVHALEDGADLAPWEVRWFEGS
jgi:sucrose phosphorylase